MNHNTNQMLPLTDSIVHNELLHFWSVLPDDPEHAFNLKNGMLDPCCFELHVLRISWHGFPCTETAVPSGGFLALLAALSPHIMCKFENLPPELKSVFLFNMCHFPPESVAPSDLWPRTHSWFKTMTCYWSSGEAELCHFRVNGLTCGPLSLCSLWWVGRFASTGPLPWRQPLRTLCSVYWWVNLFTPLQPTVQNFTWKGDTSHLKYLSDGQRFMKFWIGFKMETRIKVIRI